MDGWVGGWADGQTDRQIQINEPLISGSLRKSKFKSISSRLAVKSLFNSKFDFESTAPGIITDPARLEVLNSAQVDLLGSIPRSKYNKPFHSSSFRYRLTYIHRYVTNSGCVMCTGYFLSQPITTLENVSYISLVQQELKKIWII